MSASCAESVHAVDEQKVSVPASRRTAVSISGAARSRASASSNCGGCGVTCDLPHTATDGCTNGACTVVTCAAGYQHCDGVAADGCESQASTDVGDCGACGTVCSQLANTSATSCTAGACVIVSCDTGFANCDSTAANGCETSTIANNADCGMCGNACGASALCVNSACVSELRVFATSGVFTGNLGGLAGADAVCQQAAGSAGMGGTWIAWLADGTGSPSTRMTQSTLDYVLVDGTLIAHGWAGLTSGTLLHDIDLSELGGPPGTGSSSLLPPSVCGTAAAFTYTNVNPNGTTAWTTTQNCSNWTTTSSNSQFGSTVQTGQAWTDACEGGSCAWTVALYCIEQ